MRRDTQEKEHGGKKFSGECRSLPGGAIAGFQSLWMARRLESALVFLTVILEQAGSN